LAVFECRMMGAAVAVLAACAGLVATNAATPINLMQLAKFMLLSLVAANPRRLKPHELPGYDKSEHRSVTAG
jgi:hypothetical protein